MTTTSTKKIRIIGIGNKERGDGGIGPVVVQAICARNGIPEFIEAVEGDRDSDRLLDLLEQCDRAIIVDIAEMHMPPGHVRAIQGEHIKEEFRAHLSLEILNLAETIGAARQKGVRTPVTLMAVEPSDCSRRQGLSSILEQKLEEITEHVLKEATRPHKGLHRR